MMDERPFEGWFCRQGGEVAGPLGRSRLRRLARQGHLLPEQTVWAQRLPEGELIAPCSAAEVLRADRFAALVVDDDITAAAGLARLLREAGADHCVISTGEDSARAASALEPEAVFIDLGLPCQDGYALAGALRQLPHPPRVVALTGAEAPAGRKGTHATAFQHLLAKPADAESLREILAHLGRTTSAKAG
jgi:CheY-like chemotaxis protein